MPPIERPLVQWMGQGFLEATPSLICMMDRELNIVDANPAFTEYFGSWDNKKCFNVYKNTGAICKDCQKGREFSNPRTRVKEVLLTDPSGQKIPFIKQVFPIQESSDSPARYIVEVLTEAAQVTPNAPGMGRLFDQVPCHLIIIDKDFHIVRANKEAQAQFGAIKGRYCFAALRGRTEICPECTALETFEDGLTRTGNQIWRLDNGKMRKVQMVTKMIKGESFEKGLVMETIVDVSDTLGVESKYRSAHEHLDALIHNATDGIIGVNTKGRVTVFNPAARRIFNVAPDQVISSVDLNTIFPKRFLTRVSQGEKHVYLPEAVMKKITGETFFGRLVGTRMLQNGHHAGMAFSVQDVTHLKSLEKEKLEIERMGIVTQTVAGLAHGIKNLVNALDGGIYFLKSGITGGDIKRVHKGIEMLSRNIDRIRSYTRAFLNYARENEVNARPCHPAEILQEVIASFAAKAQAMNIGVEFCQDHTIRQVPMDYERIHEALTNLVGNAVEAFADLDDQADKKVMVKLFEEEGAIFIEVEDNGCGMDEAHQRQLFNKFFTTKGLDGTGLGLLMTQKIIQEHGGSISVTSKLSQGTRFRVRFLRSRLNRLLDA